MKEIIVASSNEGKIKEIKAVLGELGIEIKSLKDELGHSVDVDENGRMFEENAVLKAETIMKLIHKPVLADDSGLEVDALSENEDVLKMLEDEGLTVDEGMRLPGIYSARFMGYDTSYDIKNQYIIDAVEGKNRACRFVCAMALARPDNETIVVRETFEGEVNDKIEGENGFGYDPLFYFPPCKKTSAVMSMEEKNLYSHRAKALRKLSTILKEESR